MYIKTNMSSNIFTFTHFYIQMFFSALPLCCSSLDCIPSHWCLHRTCLIHNFVKWHSLVFIVIQLRDSTWLPGACGRFMWLKLYIAWSEHACDPLRGALNDSQAELPWQTAYERLQATTTLALSSLAITRLGWMTKSRGWISPARLFCGS